MKKIVSLILALVMALSLVACGTKEDTTTTDDTTTEEQKTVGFAMIALDTDFFQAITAAYEETFKAAGWNVLETTSAQYDVNTQITQIENMATQADVIITFPVNGDALTATCATARQNGVKIITMVEDTKEWDGYLSSDNYATGQSTAWLAAQYIEENYPDAEAGSIEVALLQVFDTPVDELQSTGMECITDYTDKVSIVKYECSGQTKEDGQTAAESLYTTNPNCKFFVTTSNVVCMGINEYYTGQGSPISADQLADYGCWGTNSADDVLEAIAQSAENKSMVRGINIQAGIAETAATMLYLAQGLTDGSITSKEAPATTYLVTADNVADWNANGTVSLIWDYDNETGIEQ